MSQLKSELGVELRADKIADTAETLTRRIDERFVQSGLGRIAHTIHGIANETSANIDAFKSRCGVYVLAPLVLDFSALSS